MQIGNMTLLAIARNLKDLGRFDLEIIWTTRISEVEMPLDLGLKATLRRCDKLRKIRLHLIRGCVTDSGLHYIGEFGNRLRKIKLLWIGDTDGALDDLARGCKDLQSL